MKLSILLLNRRSSSLLVHCLLPSIACLLIAPGCTRKPLPKPIAAPETPGTPVVADGPKAVPGLPSSRRFAPLLPVRRTGTKPLPVEASGIVEMLGPPATPEAAARQAAELEREYKAGVEYAPRVESIYRLADASSPQSRAVLQGLFFAEKDPDLRVQMVQSLGFVDSEDLAPSVPILQEALKASQPRELREAALDAIQAIHNPGTIPLLHIALADPDPELRESATRTIEYYQEVLARGKPRE